MFLFFFCTQHSFGQTEEKTKVAGTISYVSSQNIYVRFESTENFKEGDTLYIFQDQIAIPALLIQNFSSISCLCVPLEGINLRVSDVVYAVPTPKTQESVPEILPETEAIVAAGAEIQIDSLKSPDAKEELKQEISGRVSISSYSDFSNSIAADGQRMRYVLALDVKNINASKMSFESYISFSHKNGEWDEIKSNIHNGLKIYNLALNYKISEDMDLWLGRKINPKVSSLGAIDGVQFEKKFNAITVGAVAGSRPDWSDYSYNFKLFQAGVYAGHEFANEKINIQNTLAVVDQENNWNTDRRFLYLQHTSRIIKKLYFFGSGEFDLYKKIDGKKQNTFDLTNLFLQLRYRIFSNLSVSFAYSARNNIILYETYRTFIDQLLATETLQGFVLSTNFKPVKNINLGVKAGYRNRPGDISPSKNLYTYFNFTRLPVWDLSANVTAIFLETSYLKGKVYGISFSRDILPGKLYASAGYRNTRYDYFNQEYSLAQNLLELDLNLQLKWKISASLNYESTFDKEMNFNRIYINLTKRL